MVWQSIVFFWSGFVRYIIRSFPHGSATFGEQLIQKIGCFRIYKNTNHRPSIDRFVVRNALSQSRKIPNSCTSVQHIFFFFPVRLCNAKDLFIIILFQCYIIIIIMQALVSRLPTRHRAIPIITGPTCEPTINLLFRGPEVPSEPVSHTWNRRVNIA